MLEAKFPDLQATNSAVVDKDHNGWEHVESRLQKYMIIQDLKWVSKDDVFTQDVVCDVDCGFLAQTQYDRMAGQQATLPFVNLHQEPYVKVFFGKNEIQIPFL